MIVKRTRRAAEPGRYTARRPRFILGARPLKQACDGSILGHSRRPHDPKPIRTVHRPLGGIGRRNGFKIRRRKVCGFESHRGHALSSHVIASCRSPRRTRGCAALVRAICGAVPSVAAAWCARLGAAFRAARCARRETAGAGGGDGGRVARAGADDLRRAILLQLLLTSRGLAAAGGVDDLLDAHAERAGLTAGQLRRVGSAAAFHRGRSASASCRRRRGTRWPCVSLPFSATLRGLIAR